MEGDRIGIISPAGPVDRDALRPGIELLRSAGFKVQVAPHAYRRHSYLAGTDENRLSDFHNMFQDSEIKAILCARGGYGTMRLLDRVRYDMIRENPKILVGYSDITALLLAVYAKSGLVTFHGPLLRELSSGAAPGFKRLLGILSSHQPMKLTLNKGTPLVPGKATGPLIGGNLTLICHLLGTPFQPALNGCILFVEEKGEPLYRLDRMFTHLALAGQLDGLSGLVAGGFEGCGDMDAVEKLMVERVGHLNIPVVTGLPAGHGTDNFSLPIGLMSELDTAAMELSTLEGAVIE